MTPPARPVPTSRPDDEEPGPHGRRPGAPHDGGGSALVWPPPEHELESLEVIPLGAPAAPATGTAPQLGAGGPLPANSQASPAPGRRPVNESVPVITSWTSTVGTDPEHAPAAARWRMPVWAVFLLMLASGAAGFAAAWYLR